MMTLCSENPYVVWEKFRTISCLCSILCFCPTL